MTINEINPYIGIRGTYVSCSRENPNRKIKKVEEEIYLHDVKGISKVYHPKDREDSDNFISANKQGQTAGIHGRSFKELLDKAINDSI